MIYDDFAILEMAFAPDIFPLITQLTDQYVIRFI
mgnify:FL=1|jgi:hypothetical protein